MDCSVKCEFLRKGDLVGLIYESEDRLAHPAHARETSRDYSHCMLKFHWQSSGIIALDQMNGPTLTIEGRTRRAMRGRGSCGCGITQTGTRRKRDVTLDFDALDGGFALPADADRVDPTRIDRMFISLVPPGYVAGRKSCSRRRSREARRSANIRCDGSGSVLAIKDAVVPEHGLRIATAYDDMYNLPPERIVQAIERLGYRGVINHYVGMSHYFALDGAGMLDPTRTLNSAALAWHRDFARAAKARGYEVIWSISYEILDMFCPDAWKQRAFDGSRGADRVGPAVGAGFAGEPRGRLRSSRASPSNWWRSRSKRGCRRKCRLASRGGGCSRAVRSACTTMRRKRRSAATGGDHECARPT